MPIFLLTPLSRHADDPDWDCSRYQGPCLVVAESEGRARAYAAGAFVQPLDVVPGGGRSGMRAAWMQARLVQVRAAPPGRPIVLPLGGVIAPGHACPTLRARHDPTEEGWPAPEPHGARTLGTRATDAGPAPRDGGPSHGVAAAPPP